MIINGVIDKQLKALLEKITNIINGTTKVAKASVADSATSATSATSTDKQSVSNLTSTSGATGNLYAVWQKDTYTVTFDSQGGSGGTASVTATYGSAMPSVTPPTRTGYTFKGYYDAKSGGNKYYDGDGNSAKLMKDIMNTMNQVTDGLKESTGIDLQTVLASFAGAKLANTEDM